MPIPFFVSIGLLITMTLMAFGMWSALPADSALPHPFGWLGLGGASVRPAVALFLLPGITCLGILAFVLLPLAKPRVMEQQGRYAGAWLLFLLVMALGQGTVIRQALLAL